MSQAKSVAFIKLSINFFRRLEDAQEKLILAEKESAIAKTTQMFAHDVRKPFTMLEGVLYMIATSSPEKFETIVDEYIPEVQQSIKSVNAMIADVMEVGGNSKLNQEATHLHVLIQNTLYENFRYNKNAEIDIEYDFNHKHQLFVDNLKVSRVFSKKKLL